MNPRPLKKNGSLMMLMGAGLLAANMIWPIEGLSNEMEAMSCLTSLLMVLLGWAIYTLGEASE